MGPVSYILLGELFLQEAKAYVAPFGPIVNCFMAVIIGLLFLEITKGIGTGFSFMIFVVFCVIGLVFTIFLIPETKGKTVQEIQKMLVGNEESQPSSVSPQPQIPLKTSTKNASINMPPTEPTMDITTSSRMDIRSSKTNPKV